MTKRLFLLLLAAGCTPNFQSQDQVVDLRILAVTAEPPEAQFDLDGGSVDPVQLTVLAVDPAHPDSVATLTAQLCEPTNSRLCDQGLSIAQGTLTRDGGDLFSTTLAIPQLVLDQAVAANDLGAFDGTRVQYSFSVSDGDPAGPQTGDKIIIYSPRGGTPNQNPRMTGLLLSRDGGNFATVADGQAITMDAGDEIGVRPVLADGARETYTTTDLLGNQVTLTEDPAYSFYTTPGAQFDPTTANEAVDGGAPPEGLTRFQAFSGSGKFWVVVRDGRGGETWLTIPWSVPP
jgi:hypothetical protein